jgi:hypothetical protein
MALPCGPASRNKQHILRVLQTCVGKLGLQEGARSKILEIASGTGEHAALFASEFPNALYQPSEPLSDMIPSIEAWCEGISNVLPPINSPVESISRDILAESMRDGVDIVVNINMIHISPFECTRSLFRTASNISHPGSFALLYGPFRVNGTMVESNMAFDESLKGRDPEWGIRDIEEVQRVANEEGNYVLEFVSEMPANNLCVVFKKLEDPSVNTKEA